MQSHESLKAYEEGRSVSQRDVVKEEGESGGSEGEVRAITSMRKMWRHVVGFEM